VSKRTNSSRNSETPGSDPDIPKPLSVRLAQPPQPSADDLPRNARNLPQGRGILVIQRGDEVWERGHGEAEGQDGGGDLGAEIGVEFADEDGVVWGVLVRALRSWD
jgi:hypothetical protein